MIDHVLGRPSVKFRKVQVLAVLSFWIAYLVRGNAHGPPIVRRISTVASRKLTAWQTLILTMLWLYFARNFAKIFGLESPEPLANLYSRSYFRATWFMTALDAGFWTAMTIKPKWVRDVASIVFSAYYLFAAEQADEKVRRVRATITVDHMRISWEKSQTPYLKLLTSILHPHRNRYAPRHIRVQRPKESVYNEPIDVWIYYEGNREELKNEKKVVLDFPGGGFVAMGPRNHDDKLIGWSKKLGIPVVSVDYKKAPEYPYPYALNECYDVYHKIITTNGKCIGLSGEVCPAVAVAGDSAGGNFAAGVTLMILNTSDHDLDNSRRDSSIQALPPPAGVLLIYPSLDLNIGSWMTEEQMRLIRKRNARSRNRNVVRRKSEYLAQASGKRNMAPNTSASESEGSSDGETSTGVPKVNRPVAKALHPISPCSQRDEENKLGASGADANDTSIPHANAVLQATKPQPLSTRLAMTSRLSYFNDRILTPEMMRAMVILYVGPNNRPDFSTDFLLSPIVAPESLLERFPKCYFLTGERDPLVDDTVVFAGRIRETKWKKYKHRKEMGLLSKKERERGFDEKEHIEVRLLPGVSHGFLLMAGVFEEGKREIRKCARWLAEILADRQMGSRRRGNGPALGNSADGNDIPNEVAPNQDPTQRHHFRSGTGTSVDTYYGGTTTDEEDDLPLEMAMTSSAGERKAAKRDGRMGVAPMTSADGVKGRGGGKNLRVLGSEEDLLGRRMKGLMGPLTGLEVEHHGEVVKEGVLGLN